MKSAAMKFLVTNCLLLILLLTFGSIGVNQANAVVCEAPIDESLTTGELIGFHEINGDLFVEAREGFFRWNGSGLSLVGGARPGAIHVVYETEGGPLIGAQYGLFRFVRNDLVPVEEDQNLRKVRSILQSDDGLLIGTTYGLFRLVDKHLVSVGDGLAIGDVIKIHKVQDGIVVEAVNGLYRVDGYGLIPIVEDIDIGEINKFHQAEDQLLIAADEGLFRLKEGKLIPIGENRQKSEEEYESSNGFWLFRESKDDLLVGGATGLYKLHGDDLLRIGGDQETRAIYRFVEDGDDLLVGTELGVFLVYGDNLVEIGERRGAVWAQRFFRLHGDLLVGALPGLLRRDGMDLIPIGRNRDTGQIYGLHEVGNSVIVLAQGGVFQLDRNDLVPIYKTGDLEASEWAGGAPSNLLVGREKGLLKVEEYPLAMAKITNPRAENVDRNQTLVMTWRLEHPCASILTDEMISVVGIDDSWVKSKSIVPGNDDKWIDVKAEIRFEEESEEPYQLGLGLREAGAARFMVGSTFSVGVGLELQYYAKAYGLLIGRALLVIHTTLFVLLLLGARWSTFCWRVLTDPIFGKTGLWFYFCLRHVGPLQRWVLTPWFNEIRQNIDREPYVPMSLSENGDRECSTAEVLEPRTRSQRLWVQGNTGMGKTSMVRQMQSRFFAAAELPTLRGAYRRYRTVPVVVSLREYRHVAVDSKNPEDWVFDASRMAISAYGVRIGDRSLFQAMIRSGGFTLVLDGANEVERTDEIELFARSAPSVPLIVTSQSKGSDFFTNLHLPLQIHDEIEPLLCEFLGHEEGRAKFLALKGAHLMDEIQSGYDVRLLADLPDDIDFPEDRPGLYDLILGQARMPSRTRYPLEELCKAAWKMWRDGERKLEAGRYIDPDLIEPLTQEGTRILRILEGDKFEFRHDQMRSYLAARWAAIHEVEPRRLFEDDDEIWRLARKEQEEVWSFFAELYAVNHPDDAMELWKWSTDDAERVVLQHALQDFLNRSGHSPSMS